MEVAVLFSGGKDSTLAIEHCKERGYDIKYLLSVKPSRRDCYLFHFATVEHTPLLADAMGFKHILVGCDVSDPMKEAQIIHDVVKKNPVDAVVLGGVGLQATQIKSVREALFPLGVEVFASHKDQDNARLIEDMIDRGYEIIITEVAADGLTESWLGATLTRENFDELKALADKFGFHSGGEGGHYNSFTADGPIFRKRVKVLSSEPVMEGECDGYLRVTDLKVVNKEIQAIYR